MLYSNLIHCESKYRRSTCRYVRARQQGLFIMSTKELRAEVRIPVRHRGSLKSGDDWIPCLIENMGETGIMLMSNREFPVGQILEFKCELYPGKLLNCKLEVMHVDDTILGTKIIDIDNRGSSLCQLFLQEHYADKLNTFG